MKRQRSGNDAAEAGVGEAGARNTLDKVVSVQRFII